MSSSKAVVLFLAGFTVLLGAIVVVLNQSAETGTTTVPGHSGAVTGVMNDDAPIVDEPAASTTVSDTTVPAGPSAPDFTLPLVGGGELTLSEYEGDKPVIVDFWASWCHNCQRNMPIASQLYSEYSDEVEIIGVNIRESEATASGFLNTHGVDFPNVLDADGHVSTTYGVQYTKTKVMINRNGEVLGFFSGDITEQAIQDLIAS